MLGGSAAWRCRATVHRRSERSTSSCRDRAPSGCRWTVRTSASSRWIPAATPPTCSASATTARRRPSRAGSTCPTARSPPSPSTEPGWRPRRRARTRSSSRSSIGARIARSGSRRCSRSCPRTARSSSATSGSRRASSAPARPRRRSCCSSATPWTTSAIAGWSGSATPPTSPRAQRRARLGFRFEGIFYNHLVFKGRNRDTAWFSILDEEWPRLREAYATWLAAANFGPDGAQRQRLSELT